MTTRTELYDLVLVQTRRPELADLTNSAITAATLRAHHTDFFPRDLVQGSLPYTVTSAYFYDFASIGALLPRLRSLKHIQSTDPVTGTPTEQLEYRESDDLYDRDGCRRPSVYTLVGDTLRTYPQSQTGLHTAFYFQNPVTAGLTYSSWIADTYPEELATWAAGIVFARTGFLEQAQAFQEQHIKPFKAMLIESHLLGNVN